MKIIKKVTVFLVLSLLLSSCYDDFIEDFDYTLTYFSSQQPLRTIVADGDMTFQVGATLAGMREDDGTAQVFFELDTSLLSEISDASGFTLLPESYYELSNDSEFDVQPTSHLRVVNVTLNEALFTADPDALTTTYALPFRITDATVDSIAGNNDSISIDSRNITIVAVKYISQYHGYYYSRGVQYTLDASGIPVDTLTYFDDDLSQNDVVEFSTLAIDKVMTSRIGGNLSGGFEFTMNADGSVSVASSSVTIEEGTVAYSTEDQTYSIDITVDKNGTKYKIEEELILRQDPELDLRFEEW